MISDVDICNRALSWLGEQRIVSLGDPDPRSTVCNLHYHEERDALLSEYPWTFANRQEPLALLENDRAPQWRNRYRRPARLARIEWVNTLEEAIARRRIGHVASSPYEVSGASIYSDTNIAWINYTKLIEDPSEFSPLFRVALSWCVARAVAIPLTQDRGRLEYAEAKADRATDVAQTADAGLMVHDDRHAPEAWLDGL